VRRRVVSMIVGGVGRRCSRAAWDLFLNNMQFIC
jgi:hypothetical protein